MAPWVPAFTSAVSRHAESAAFVTFSFATVDIEGCPNVRTCIFRGFLFDDKKTNILTFTTDVRMEKFEHLLKNPKFEACFWFPNSNVQFRLSGNARCVTLGNISTTNAEIGDYPLVSPNVIEQYSSNTDLSHMLPQEPHKPSAEEWEQELTNKWVNLSTKLKSSFRKPEPGSKVTPEKQKLLDSISRGVDGSNEEDGKKNYALVLLLVDKVDYVDLNGHQARYIYERYDEDQWSEEEVCP
jgi:hypothetical protein